MKKSLRKEILEKRDNLGGIKEKSRIIKEKLFNSEEYQNSKTVMFYVSFISEVYTHDMIKEALRDKIVVVPKLKGNCLIPCRIDSFNELDFKNEYGILEPSGVNGIDKDKIDLVIVPGVVFDKEGYRIGYGKGCYDIFLEGMKSKKIGLAFDAQVVDALPTEKHDVRMDKTITEKRIIK